MAFADDSPSANAAASAPSREEPDQTPLPSHESGPPDEIWPAYFSEHRPSERAVRRVVLRLTELGEHEHVIYLIQSALLNGQAQPWMYEVLASSMTLAGRPESEVQRVVLSLTDFGNVNVDSLLIAGAYLTRFERDEAALRMYRQASRIAPERPEPYILGLRVARKLKRPEDVQWTAAGVIQYAWTKNADELHHEAESAALEASEWLKTSGDEAALAELQQAIASARRLDLQIQVTWNGTADLDLIVEEPTGTVCSFETPETIGGGLHLHDGYGPRADNCVETYVCPRAVSGEYKIRVRHVFGDVVGQRAQVAIITHSGSEQEATRRETVIVSADDAVITFKLADGRREQPRTVSTRQLDPLGVRKVVESMRFLNRPEALSPEEAAALRRFQQGRELLFQQTAAQTSRPFVTGAVGFQPVVTMLNDGATLTTNAIVSPDRRYVRVAVNPVFSTLTDVFTFSFVSGFDPFGGRNTGLNGVGGN